ncbi:cation-translocating P-type ATPase [Legionella impletisoli]|uniref:Calcium-transporting ATPase n=1 Tax=Legionella impletisoli TaxID=343510 RepID=A0A917JVU6_9GAMM|nr:cation-transporting P-type ATPase [Legionella impletisoli]GGI86130.1 calcium-transporting ATPase [Legionella impletisoli]
MQAWHAKSVGKTKTILAESSKDHGPNELQQVKSTHWYTMLARQFFNILILVLVLATILSFFLGDMIDAIAILAIVLFNGLLGFIQEWKAENAINELKEMLSPKCKIIKDGEETVVDAKSLKPGDCVLLNAGDVVPADVRLTQSANLTVNEAALTGESAPIAKKTEALSEDTPLTERNNMAFMGTHVVSGRARGLVVEIGMNTQFGRIAELTERVSETKTRLQKELSVLGKQFGVIALLISSLVVIVGILSGRGIMDMFMTGISLAVSAIPEGLPAVVTIALALGVRAMARKKALLRQLQAAETLGAVSIICTDKTGTLTKNEMKVQKVWQANATYTITGSGYNPSGTFEKDNEPIAPETHSDLMALIETARTCNNARIKQEDDKKIWKAVGSPDEAALMVMAMKANLEQEPDEEILDEFSFDSNRKRMSVVVNHNSESIVHVKGAPEVILSLSTRYLLDGEQKELTDDMRKSIEKAYSELAEEGLRTLALAMKKSQKEEKFTANKAERELTFLGMVGLVDPPREEVPKAIEKAKLAGIQVMMITGDSPITAKAIASQIGLEVDKIVTSSDVQDLSDDELSKLLQTKVLFARTVPEDKLRIVKLLQSQDQLAAMTGDGVNDAPALKQADIGIAMGIRGTDVAKSVADIVLTDDNFASIIAAVQEGRRQYSNIQKFVLFLASSNMGEVLAILINIFMGGPLIMVPIQILWINLVTDSATAISLSVEQPETDIMKHPPRKINQPIFSWNSFMLLVLFGAYIGMVAYLLYRFYLNESYELANTVAFTAIAVMANIHALNFRNLQRPIAEIGWLSNPWLLLAIASMIGLQLLAIYMPPLQVVLHTTALSASEWGVIILSALPLFLIPECVKWLWNRTS